MGIKFAGGGGNSGNTSAPGPLGGADSRNLKYPNAGGLANGGKWDGTRGIRFG